MEEITAITEVTALEGLKYLAQKSKESFAEKATVEALSQKVDGIEVPAKLSDLENDEGYQTESEVSTAINAHIGKVFKPSGTVAFESLPTPSAEVLGNVYNVSNKFTTDSRFVEGDGQKHPAGTNVAVVQISDDYKFDVFAGEIDLSNYVTKDGEKVLSTNDFTDEHKEKLESIKIAPIDEVKQEIDAIFASKE